MHNVPDVIDLGCAMTTNPQVSSRPIDGAIRGMARPDAGEERMPAPAGWWLVPAFLVGAAMIGAAAFFWGLLVTFGGLCALTGLMAAFAARVAARAASGRP